MYLTHTGLRWLVQSRKQDSQSSSQQMAEEWIFEYFLQSEGMFDVERKEGQGP